MSCRRITSKSNALQTTAVNEGIPSNAGDALANNHTRQIRAPLEGRLPNTGDAVGNRHARQTTAAPEGLISNAGDIIGNRHVRQASALFEGPQSNDGDRFSVIGGRDHHVNDGLLAICDGDGLSYNFIRQRITINLINPAEQQNHDCDCCE